MKNPSENSARLAELRWERGHTHTDMLRAMKLTAREFNRMVALRKTNEIIEQYEKLVPPNPQVADNQKHVATLKALRAERGHTLCQMLRVIDMTESRYREMLAAKKAEEVLREYAALEERPNAAAWGAMSDADIIRKVSKPKLPPVGTILENGDERVKVIRHTGYDSILVEWTDAERKIRRAEWTTTPHPRQTDRGTWEAKR